MFKVCYWLIIYKYRLIKDAVICLQTGMINVKRKLRHLALINFRQTQHATIFKIDAAVYISAWVAERNFGGCLKNSFGVFNGKRKSLY